MDLPPAVRRSFQDQGRRGGLERARRLTPEARRRIGRRAAVTRWTQARFGSPRFEPLGLPGAALVDRGLDDLTAGRATRESLAVSLAAPRLKREGVPVPRTVHAEADHRLYRLLESRHGALAHARYLAVLREVQSFADACRSVRRGEVDRAR